MKIFEIKLKMTLLGRNEKWMKFLSVNMPEESDNNGENDDLKEPLNDEELKQKEDEVKSESIRIKMMRGNFQDDEEGNDEEDLWSNPSWSEKETLLYEDPFRSETKFVMHGDLLAVERQGRDFTPLELSLLRKVEMERASLLPALSKTNPIDMREKELTKRFVTISKL